MIILKILLYIILAVLGLILLVLIVPAGGEFSYIDGKLRYKVKLSILNIMDSEGGGVLGWLKKRKSKPKKPKKPKEPKPVKEKKSRNKKSQREPYEWETELDEIPVNIPDEMDSGDTAEVPGSASATADSASEETSDGAAAESSGDEKKKKKKKNKQQDELPEETDLGDEPEKDSGKEKKSLSDMIEFIIGIWESAQRPLLKIFKGFKLKELYIDFVIADEDAYNCALKYGKYSGLIYNGIAFFSQVFTVRLKTVDIRPAFGLSKGRWDAAGKLSFRLGTVVIAGLWFLITYIFRTFIPDRFRKRKLRKSAARQK